MLFQTLIQPANLLELPQAHQGPRGVTGERLQRAQIEPIDIDRRVRGDLERAQNLGRSPAEG